MKNEIETDDNLEICDDCNEEFDRKELRICSGCRMKLCSICLDLHADEHWAEKEEDDEDDN